MEGGPSWQRLNGLFEPALLPASPDHVILSGLVMFRSMKPNDGNVCRATGFVFVVLPLVSVPAADLRDNNGSTGPCDLARAVRATGRRVSGALRYWNDL